MEIPNQCLKSTVNKCPWPTGLENNGLSDKVLRLLEFCGNQTIKKSDIRHIDSSPPVTVNAFRLLERIRSSTIGNF